MNSLEALRILSECANGEKKLIFSDSLNLESTIKQDLERLEKFEKAIEILKDKFNLKVQILVFYDNREEYHLELQSHHTEYSFPISKDLYKLLKEVLEDE